MDIAVDLHAHSMFAGGSGGLKVKDKESLKESFKQAHTRFIEADKTSKLKGINILGTGDIQFTPWLNFIEKNFEEDQGLYRYKNNEDLLYCLQTEIIITAEVKQKVRKSVHTVILFPNFESVYRFKDFLDTYEVKQENIPRPFLKVENNQAVSEALQKLQEIDKQIEIIPGHIMTPDGVYGGNNGVNSLYDFFGEFEQKIKVVETGLSADPEILSLIPELDYRTLLSNADAHSAQLNRIGREFTVLDMNKKSYSSMIEALRTKKIAYSLEFPVTEGRYFFTGHRANRKKPGKGHTKDQFCYFSPDKVPKDNICPICDATLTKGVLQRAIEISSTQGGEQRIKNFKEGQTENIEQKYLHGVPLVELIANSLNIVSSSAKAVLNNYYKIVEEFKNEVSLWQTDYEKIEQNFPNQVPKSILEGLKFIKNDNFCFTPPGFDGEYGKLALGKKMTFFGHSQVKN